MRIAWVSPLVLTLAIGVMGGATVHANPQTGPTITNQAQDERGRVVYLRALKDMGLDSDGRDFCLEKVQEIHQHQVGCSIVLAYVTHLMQIQESRRENLGRVSPRLSKALGDLAKILKEGKTPQVRPQ